MGWHIFMFVLWCMGHPLISIGVVLAIVVLIWLALEDD